MVGLGSGVGWVGDVPFALVEFVVVAVAEGDEVVGGQVGHGAPGRAGRRSSHRLHPPTRSVHWAACAATRAMRA